MNRYNITYSFNNSHLHIQLFDTLNDTKYENKILNYTKNMNLIYNLLYNNIQIINKDYYIILKYNTQELILQKIDDISVFSYIQILHIIIVYLIIIIVCLLFYKKIALFN